MLASTFLRCATDLRRLVKLGSQFAETQRVLRHMTTNRTGKAGDDIFCTPMMIEQMNDIVLRNVSAPARILRVQCTHKAPLALGELFLLEGEATEVSDSTATFHVLCTSVGANSRVLGDATMTIKAI